MQSTIGERGIDQEMQHEELERVSQNLFLLDLEQDMEGYRKFISCWIYKSDEGNFLVDPGPSSTIPKLISALRALNIEKLDYALLTHLHLDHAGGIGNLVKEFPTQVAVHEGALKHLIDPSKLWAGSLSILGEVAEKYGRMEPVPRDMLISEQEIALGNKTIKALDTKGHAPHHRSYLFDGILFPGEASGVYLDLGGGDFYLRPPTPPPFHLETAIDSLDKLGKLDFSMLCFGHFGHSSNPAVVKEFQEQLLRWKDTIGRVLSKHYLSEDRLIEECIDRLKEEDPLFGKITRLDEDIQARERYYAENSIRGFLSYLRKEYV